MGLTDSLAVCLMFLRWFPVLHLFDWYLAGLQFDGGLVMVDRSVFVGLMVRVQVVFPGGWLISKWLIRLFSLRVVAMYQTVYQRSRIIIHLQLCVNDSFGVPWWIVS